MSTRTRHHAGDVLQAARQAAERRNEAFRPRRCRPRGGSLQRENRKLKETIGELTMELKKTTVSNAGMEGFSATKSAGSSVRYMASGTWNTSNSKSANFPKSTRKKQYNSLSETVEKVCLCPHRGRGTARIRRGEYGGKRKRCPETGKIGEKCGFEFDYFEKGSIVFKETYNTASGTARAREQARRSSGRKLNLRQEGASPP